MANLSQKKRQRMLAFLNTLKAQNKDDDNTLMAINEIETALNAKKYGLVWEKHEEAVDVKMQTHIPVFAEDTDKEITAVSGEGYNFLLEGDNLHSLKLLEKTHKGKIDVIYIDPPYNTGNKDFMYDDVYVDSSDSYSHSKWLSFMNRRLLHARNLLSDQGLIFISINNKELGQLRLLCDEVFGESNFLGIITWESTTQPINAGNARFQLQQKSEYILCFAKNKAKKTEFILTPNKSTFSYTHEGKLGKCRFEIIEKSDSGRDNRESMKFPILGRYPREGKRWQIGFDTAQDLIKRNRIEIVDGIVKKAVYPEDESNRISYEPFWSHFTADSVGTSQIGKNELNTVLGRKVGFDTVKPIMLVKELLKHFPKDILVLDFFAGSGTTAHAVISANKEDGGNRKFILCTNNENNICTNVTYPRIKKVIKGYDYVGKKTEVLFTHKIIQKSLENGPELLEDVKMITKEYKDSYDKISTSIKDGIITVTGIKNYDKKMDGIPANLKYYYTDFVAKDEEFLSDALLAHVAEMIQLEHGIKLDGKHYLMVMSDEEADELESRWNEYEDIKAIYISSNVLLTMEQERLFKDVEVYTIPDYYFNSELREVGEAW